MQFGIFSVGDVTTDPTTGRTPSEAERIEGQVRGLHRMVDEEQYCIDILTQVSAMTKALHAVSIGLLEDHMNHCVADAARVGDAEAREKVAEATEAIARLVRS